MRREKLISEFSKIVSQAFDSVEEYVMQLFPDLMVFDVQLKDMNAFCPEIQTRVEVPITIASLVYIGRLVSLIKVQFYKAGFLGLKVIKSSFSNNPYREGSLVLHINFVGQCDMRDIIKKHSVKEVGGVK